MSSIVVLGSCNTDLIAYVAERFPREGETMHGTRFSTGFGGKGANQAVMSSRLGSVVHFIGAVGEDAFGRDTLSNFAACGVHHEHVRTVSGSSTGSATIIVNEATGENCIVIVAGANGTLGPADVAAAEGLLAACSTVVAQLEAPLEATVALLRRSRQLGKRTVLNPAPAAAGLPAELFALCDWVILNETELELVTGRSAQGPELLAAARFLRDERGSGNVLITLGARGCVALLQGAAALLEVPCPTATSKPVDTTGAGDAFVGAFCHYLSAGQLSTELCLRHAVEVASLTVLQRGTQLSYPQRQELPEHLQ